MIISQWTSPGGEIQAALDVRRAVFQDELGQSAEQVFDGADTLCWQLAFLDEGTPIAAGRIGYHSPGAAELSQICVVRPGGRDTEDADPQSRNPWYETGRRDLSPGRGRVF